MLESSVDIVTLIFVLSAVHPDKMKLALQNISRVRAETDTKWKDSDLKVLGKKVKFEHIS